MRVLKPGSEQSGWSKKVTCTGAGNGGGGCRARLLVEWTDLFKTFRSCRDEMETFITFQCCECGTLTDIERVPLPITEKLPNRKNWQAAHRRNSAVDHGY